MFKRTTVYNVWLTNLAILIIAILAFTFGLVVDAYSYVLDDAPSMTPYKYYKVDNW